MIYLDNAATTRIRPEVRAAMEPFLDQEYGNPSSMHAAGRRARRALEDARETAAGCLGADPREIVFTSGATESNQLALAGLAGALRGRRDHLVTTRIEHPSVLASVARLEEQRWSATRLPVDAGGRIEPERVSAAVTPRTGLVSVMWVNNEVGTVQPISAIRRAVPGILVHTDAAQAFGKVAIDLDQVDLLTLSAHKFHGPKGAGLLWIRRGTPLEPQLLGGGQEFERRAGTENIAAAVGLAAAMKTASRSDLDRMETLRERLREGLERRAGARTAGSREFRAPHILNVSFDGVDGEAAILALDAAGICISAGSACASLGSKPSHVLEAMGLPADQVKSSVRFSVSALTTAGEIDAVLSAVPAIIDRLRAISPVSP